MELIIIKTKNSQPIKKLLQKKHIAYEVYQEPKNFPKQKQNIFANYDQAIQNKQREKELKL